MYYSMDSTNLDCYDGTFVLINKLDIRSQEELDNVEQTITAINAAEIEERQEFINIDADELMVATIKSATGDIFALKDILYNNIK